MTPSGISLRPDTRDLAALRARLVTLLAQGQQDEALDLVIELLGHLRDDNDALQVRLKSALRRLHGRSSEKLSAEQLSLFARILGDDAPAPTPATPPPAAKDPATSTGAPLPRRGTPHGRSDKPTTLPEEVATCVVADDDRRCDDCGAEMPSIGFEESWQVEYRPGHFVVQTARCERVACARCRRVIAVPPPPKVIPGGQPGPGLLAKVLVDKAEDHLPLERQQRRLAREGLAVPITTLAGWWATAADLLRPLHAAVVAEAMGSFLPQLDATGLAVLDRDHLKGVRQGHLWTVAGGRAAAFVYTPVKSGGLETLLEMRPLVEGSATCRQPVQCDGETLFTSIQTRTGVRLALVHDWMHARRYFERAVQSGDLRAAVAMRLIGELYEVERAATAAGVDAEERGRRRRELSWPILERLRSWIGEVRGGVNPTSPLGKAIGYVERRWISLAVFAGDGRIPIDTGEVERTIRRVAVGRNNWLFTGGDEAAERLATVASLCATCRRLGIDPWRYLCAVFVAIAEGISHAALVRGFTPWAWAEHEAQKANAQQLAAVG